MEQNRVGIVTSVYGSTNYGGMLQGYALVRTCQKLGYEAIQISIDKTKVTTKEYRIKDSQNTIKWINHKMNSVNTRIRRCILEKYFCGNDRKNRYKEFFMTYIPHTDIVYTSANIRETNELFDIFICGSDVIWGQSEIQIPDIFYLSFVNENKKKIAYAPSFGKTFIPQNNVSKTKKLLSRFNSLSVRENSGQRIVKDLGFPAQVVVDPTFLLSKNDWEQLCKNEQTSNNKKKYAFAYLLGNSAENRKAVIDYCKKESLELITVPFGTNKFQFGELGFGDQRELAADPIIWLNLIRNAEIVFTDSFHGVVFSVIFNTPFFALKRFSDEDKKSLNTRMDNLMQLLGTEDRYVAAKNIDTASGKDLNWKEINIKREMATNESLCYLKKALED